ncbi:MAG TPA: NUDIX domain-containing protein, partial [Caldimonas sp.]|nr:NUDIX domain-containing protein [Caldimonas sp.]
MSISPAADSATSAAVAAGGERPPRPAATIVVLRDGPRGIEVLLSRRAERGDHNSGAWVFPGGIVESSDALAHGAC